jgi:hypothetical protein
MNVSSQRRIFIENVHKQGGYLRTPPAVAESCCAL